MDTSRAIQNMKLITPRVCPTCCCNKESRYIKQEWHFIHHTHCNEHKVRLIDKCPCCLEVLEANGEILSGCAKCGIRWSDYCAIPEELPAYQIVLRGLSEVEQSDFVLMLYRAFVIVSRPFDCAHESFRRLPISDVDVVHQLNQAYGLLTSESFRSNWRKAREERLLADEELLFLTRKQISSLVILPSINQPTYLRDEEFQVDFLPIEDDNYVHSSRKILLHSDTELCHQVPKKVAAYLLQLDTKSIDYLMDTKQINFVRQTSSITGAFINLLDINSFVNKLTSKAIIKEHCGDVDNLISLKKLRRGARFFNADLAKLISLLIDNPIQLYYCSPIVTLSFDELYVDRDEITAILEREFVPSFSEQVSESKVRDMCFLSKKQYKILKEKFGLTSIEVKYKYSYVSPEKLSYFFSKYMLLNRWVKIHDVKLKALVKYLDSQPDLIRNLSVNEHNIVLYEKNENLKVALNKFLILTSGEPQKLAAFCF